MSFPRYPLYKDSGMEWLGEVPEHWTLRPMWTDFRRVKRVGFGEEELLSVYRDHGVVPKSSRDDNFNNPSEDLNTYQLVVPGDLVINKMKAWQGSVAVSDYQGIVSPAYFVYTALHSECSRYLHYLMRSPEYTAGYLSLSKGIRIGQWDLEPDKHSRMPVVHPPAEEQASIASFLDHETAKIDALIAEQRCLIDLLKEKRQAVISHAVTRGLNPGSPMKPSNIAWLGDVPAHWEVVPLKRVITTIEQGWSPQCENYPAEGSDEWAVLKVGCVNGGEFRPWENKSLPPALQPIPELGIQAGDVLISRANTRELVGSTAVVKDNYPRLMLCDKLYRVRMLQGLCLPEFLAYYLGSRVARGQIELGATGASASMLNIGQATILEMPVPVPPPTVQREIVSYLDMSTVAANTLTSEAERAIALLQERRTALISAAVTGKIDVRNIGEAA